MSIIIDALRKADHLKKWKNISKMGVFGSHHESNAPEQGLTAHSDEKLEGPANNWFDPPFRVHFERTGDKAGGKRAPFQVHLAKIIFVAVVICLLVAIMVGSWNRTTPNQILLLQKPKVAPGPIQVIEPKPIAPEKKSTFQPYSSPDVKVSVRPIPRTIHNPAPESIYKLTGISVLADGSRAAFINDKVVEVGARVGDAEVVAIHEKEVVLKRGAREFSLLWE